MGYSVSPEAESDLEEVFFYGFKTWGEERAFTFLESLYARFEWLAEHPEIAPIRQDLQPPVYRSWLQNPYVIFYHIKGEQIEILAVIHGKKDILAHFK